MIAARLIAWYKQNKRDLPWRDTKDPYKIWLSEIILQQTRVAQGLPYYLKFVEAFPTVFDLAHAPQQKVLKLWQGLGYYSRARNLHEAAKQVVKMHKGRFPESFSELKQLKGVGDYTAAAIASFCFNKPHAVVDGNVFRVLARLYAIDTPINSASGKKQFSALANELIDRKNPGIFNQAIMEFGAKQCAPARPACPDCVLQDKCLAFGQNKVDQYPAKNAAAASKTRYFEYFFLQQEDRTYIQKRGAGDIWEGLYQLPVLESNARLSTQKVLEHFEKQVFMSTKVKFEVKKVSIAKKHLLSHQTILARFWHIELNSRKKLPGYRSVAVNKLKKYPFPVLIGRHLREITIFE